MKVWGQGCHPAAWGTPQMIGVHLEEVSQTAMFFFHCACCFNSVQEMTAESKIPMINTWL